MSIYLFMIGDFSLIDILFYLPHKPKGASHQIRLFTSRKRVQLSV